MGEKPSLIEFCPLWHGPNSLMERFQTINVILIVQGVGLMVILFPMAIFLCHGKVPCGVVLLSWTKSEFCKFFFCEVPSGTFCNFSILSLFLLKFLSFLPVTFVSVLQRI
jgi:hypothetical protein